MTYTSANSHKQVDAYSHDGEEQKTLIWRRHKQTY